MSILSQQIASASRRSEQRRQALIRQAEKLIQDPNKETRILANTCIPCFYVPRIAGQAFTSFVCENCDKVCKHSNTNTPYVCEACSAQLGVCRHCLAKVDDSPNQEGGANES